MISRNALLAILAALALLFAVSCVGGDYNTEARTILVDVPASVFNPANFADPGLRGPGIDKISVTVNCLVGKTATPFTASITALDIPGGQAFGSMSIPVSGELVSINAQASLAGAEVVSVLLDKLTELDIGRYGNYSAFQNLTVFKLDWQASATPAGLLSARPCPRSNVSILFDSGLTPTGGHTDIATSLATRQVAIQLTANENSTGGVLSYDIYYALASENPEQYTTANFSNTYLSYPWTSQWSYDEVTGGVGKQVNDTVYKMVKFSAGLVAGAADAGGKYGVKLDFTPINGADAGKWLLVCAVLTRAGVSIPSQVVCIPIK